MTLINLKTREDYDKIQKELPLEGRDRDLGEVHNMELDSIVESHKQLIRKLKYLWPSLVNPTHFLFPKTIEDYKQFGVFEPHVKVEPYECYFNEKAKACLRDFSDTIYEIPEIKDSVSYNTICHTTVSFVERAVSERMKQKIKADPEKDVVSLIQSLLNVRAPFEFYRVVEGVKLEGVDSLIMGDVEFFNYSEAREKDLQKCREDNNENGFFDQTIIPFVEKHFLNRICVKAAATGDQRKAEEISIKKIRQALNILRFIICLLRPETMHDHRLKINLLSESYDISEGTMHLNLSDNTISLSFGKTRKPFDTLPIDVSLLENLKQNYFLGDLFIMLTSDKRSELEENILTSIYWIGEAQNDFLSESAFIKCWTALETIFSIDEDGITEALGRSIPILLAAGGYRFIKLDDIEEVHKKVMRLYRKRSKVVHRGLYETVSPLELVEVCKYAVWCVLTCLRLRTMGYLNLEQIRVEANRLYEASLRHSRN